MKHNKTEWMCGYVFVYDIILVLYNYQSFNVQVPKWQICIISMYGDTFVWCYVILFSQCQINNNFVSVLCKT